jgi:hypothetical protein
VSSSILISSGHTGYSAEGKTSLLINETSLPVGQLDPDFLLLKAPLNHPPGDATIFLFVGGNERRWNVHLPEAVSAGSRRVTIANCK